MSNDGVQGPLPSGGDGWPPGSWTSLACWPASQDVPAFADPSVFQLSKGDGMSPCGSFSYMWLQTGSNGDAVTTAELLVVVWLLPGFLAHVLRSLHKRSSCIARDNNRCESYRKQANTEACCFLFNMLLDLNFMTQKHQRGENAIPVHKHDVFVPACHFQLQVSATEGRSPAAQHLWTWVPRAVLNWTPRRRWRIFSMEALASW